jgi:hypothetical protein
MSAEARLHSLQINLATHQRNAGRDYNEIHIPDSIKLYLTTTPTERLDTESIGNENLFAYRFGFDAPHVVREQVIAIKQRYGFTCREMRRLRQSGQLRIKGTQVVLSPALSIAVMGWFQLSLVSLMSIAMFAQVLLSSAPAWKQLLAQLVIATIWFGSAWVLKAQFIGPWQLLRRAGVK